MAERCTVHNKLMRYSGRTIRGQPGHRAVRITRVPESRTRTNCPQPPPALPSAFRSAPTTYSAYTVVTQPHEGRPAATRGPTAQYILDCFVRHKNERFVSATLVLLCIFTRSGNLHTLRVRTSILSFYFLK